MLRFLTLLESVINIQQRKVVSIDVSEFHFAVVSSFLCFVWTHENLLHWNGIEERKIK